MKIVINCAFGGFEIPDEMIEPLGLGPMDYFNDSDNIRTNPLLIEWVYANDSDLGVVTIPEDATDWEINEYDGLESVTAVINGKLVHLRADR